MESMWRRREEAGLGALERGPIGRDEGQLTQSRQETSDSPGTEEESTWRDAQKELEENLRT